MALLPKFKKINNAQELDVFASTYTQCSGFNVNRDYYENNQVFCVYWQERMVAGFVLGTGETLRTLEVFVGEEHRSGLYQKVKDAVPHTEMCCFWMEPGTRKKTLLNFFVWFCVAYALRFFGTQQLIFGTNSVRLAALYSAASKASLIHADFLNQKQTFVFTGPRHYCLLGVAQILFYKFKRIVKITHKRIASINVEFIHTSNSNTMKNNKICLAKNKLMLCVLVCWYAGQTLLAQTPIALKVYNGQYICAENGGGQEVVANRSAKGPWETFIMEYLGNNQVALKANTGHYLCAENGGGSYLIANRTALGPWETFTLENLGNRQIALKAANGQYLCAEGGGGLAVVANRSTRDVWETFTIEIDPQFVSFQSFNYPNTYIRHSNSIGWISQISSDLDQKDASFKIVQGLDPNCAECVSFESVNYPGKFLRHNNYIIALSTIEGEVARKDASFRRVPGLVGAGYSYESSNYPNYYIRHSYSKLQISARTNDALVLNDASFYEKSAFYK